MKDDWFWRVCAVGALLVALGYVVSRFTAAPPVYAGGDGGFILEAAITTQGIVDKVYVLDTTRKCLILYGSPQRNDITMLSSRYIDVDCQATVGKSFPGRPRGWSIVEMKRELDKPKGGARRAR